MTRFERRVRQLEARAGGGRATIPAEWEIWIELKDGRMRGKHGEIISRKAFEQRRPFARTIVILPDNGRDDLDAILSQGYTDSQHSANLAARAGRETTSIAATAAAMSSSKSRIV